MLLLSDCLGEMTQRWGENCVIWIILSAVTYAFDKHVQNESVFISLFLFLWTIILSSKSGYLVFGKDQDRGDMSNGMK